MKPEGSPSFEQVGAITFFPSKGNPVAATCGGTDILKTMFEAFGYKVVSAPELVPKRNKPTKNLDNRAENKPDNRRK